MDILSVLVNEVSPLQRRVNFFLILSADGKSPATKITGQPQISADGDGWTDAGIGQLVEVGNGEYYADLAQSAITIVGVKIRTRFQDNPKKVVEARGTTVIVVAFDPYSPPQISTSPVCPYCNNPLSIVAGSR